MKEGKKTKYIEEENERMRKGGLEMTQLWDQNQVLFQMKFGNKKQTKYCYKISSLISY
jgi:hypothetical protein